MREPSECTKRAAHHRIDLCFEEVVAVQRVRTSARSKFGEVKLPYLPAGLPWRSFGSGPERLVAGFLALLFRIPLSFPMLSRTRPRIVDVFLPRALASCTRALAQFLPCRQGDVLPARQRARFMAVAAAQNDRGLQPPATQRPRCECHMTTVLVLTSSAVPRRAAVVWERSRRTEH